MVTVCIFFGPAGCGKTSIATAISESFKCPYIEGDTLHSKNNVEKMKSGRPLNDDDRWVWLRTVKQKFIDDSEALKTSNQTKLVVVTCSALKLVYRNILRDIDKPGIKIIFVYLRVSREVLSQRLLNRKGHFMAASMMDSQLEILEEPKSDEPNVWVIDANESFEAIISTLRKKISDELSISTIR